MNAPFTLVDTTRFGNLRRPRNEVLEEKQKGSNYQRLSQGRALFEGDYEVLREGEIAAEEARLLDEAVRYIEPKIRDKKLREIFFSIIGIQKEAAGKVSETFGRERREDDPEDLMDNPEYQRVFLYSRPEHEIYGKGWGSIGVQRLGVFAQKDIAAVGLEILFRTIDEIRGNLATLGRKTTIRRELLLGSGQVVQQIEKQRGGCVLGMRRYLDLGVQNEPRRILNWGEVDGEPIKPYHDERRSEIRIPEGLLGHLTLPVPRAFERTESIVEHILDQFKIDLCSAHNAANRKGSPKVIDHPVFEK